MKIEQRIVISQLSIANWTQYSIVNYHLIRRKIMNKFLLKLYVAGKTPRAERAIANLQRICDEVLNGQYQLVIIDVLERPQLAEDEKILATPTLVKELPSPLARVIGDLSDQDKVLLGLDLQPVMTKEGGEK